MIFPAFLFYLLSAAVVVAQEAHNLVKKHPAPREDPNEIQGVSPPGRCVDSCINVYGYASMFYPPLEKPPPSLTATVKALVTEPPQRPTPERPYGFDTNKLCYNDEFMEAAPHCIDCLFRTRREVDWRSTLLNSFLTCMYDLDALACPHSCGHVDKLVEECRRIDSGEIEDPNPVDHSVDKRNPPCVCRPKNRAAVMKCFHCMLNWNATLAQNWLRFISKCNDWNEFPF